MWIELALFVAMLAFCACLARRLNRLEREVGALRRWQPKGDSPRLSLYHRQKLGEAARALEAFAGKTKGADEPGPGLSSPLEKPKGGE